MVFAKNLYFLLVVYCTTDVLSESVIAPCKIDDDSCINTSAQAAIPKILAGFPELGVKSSDPLIIDRLEGNITDFAYVFFNTAVTGFKDCAVSNIKIDSKLTNLHYEMKCSTVKLEGEYQMGGQIISLPVEGKGHFTVITGTYYFNVDSKLQTTVSDGKTYLSIGEIKLKYDILVPGTYAFDNLFNGQKDKADEFHKIANENFITIQKQADGPSWKAIFDNIKGNVNAYLKSIPLEDYKL